MKNRRRLFSDKDGTTLPQDLQNISEEIKAWFNHLPMEIKKLMPIAEKAVHFLQELDDMLEDGQPVNEALEKVLAMTKTEVDDRAYEVFKDYLEDFADRATDWFNQFLTWNTAEIKMDIAAILIIGIEGATNLQADTAAQFAVYAYKS